MRRLFAVMATAAMLLVVGCGGDDDAGGPAGDTTEDAEAATTSGSEDDPEAAATEPDGSTSEEGEGSAGADEPDDADDADDAEGSAAELCAALEPTRDIDPSVLPAPDDVALLAAAADAAPTDDLREDIQTIVDYAEQLAGLDPGDEDDLATGTELASDPELLASVASVRTYAEDECGFDLPFLAEFDTGSSDGGGDSDAGGGSEDEVDTDAVRDELEASAPQFEAGLLGIADLGGTYLASIAGLTADDVVAACDALSAAFVAVDPAYAGIPVQAADAEGAVLAEGEAGSACAAA